MNTTTRTLARAFLRGFAFIFCLAAQSVTATLFVDMASTPLGGGIFQYDFSIENTGPDDVVLVTITDAPISDPLINPTAPAAFGAAYDSGLGFVDFFESTSLFKAGSTTGGFQFQSMGTPPEYFTSFQALTHNGDVLTGKIRLNSVPETGSTVLMAGLGFVALTFLRRKF